jgi:hypothetical protein
MALRPRRTGVSYFGTLVTDPSFRHWTPDEDPEAADTLDGGLGKDSCVESAGSTTIACEG